MPDDELTITRLLRRYGAAVDGKRWTVFDDIFAHDVRADYGGPEQFEGLEAFKRGAAQAWGTFDVSQHSMSNTVWEQEGDQGRSLTYGTWFIVRRGTPGGDVWEGKGWYYDEWARSPFGWRIAKRCCRPMWWSGNVLVADATFDPAAFDPNVEIKCYSLSDALDEGLFQIKTLRAA